MAGKPWEELQTVEFLEKARAIKEYRGGKLRRESLTELKEMFEERKMDELKWVFDADLEINEDWFNEGHGTRGDTRKRSEGAVIKFLVDRFVSCSILLINLFFHVYCVNLINIFVNQWELGIAEYIILHRCGNLITTEKRCPYLVYDNAS